MISAQLKIPFFVKLFLVITKFTLVIIMLFLVVAVFFIGSGVVKPEKSWDIITTEGPMK